MSKRRALVVPWVFAWPHLPRLADAIVRLHEDGQPRALGVPGRVGEKGPEVGLNSPVEHRVRGLAGLIGGRGSAAPGHGLCGEHAPCRDGSSQDWLPLP